MERQFMENVLLAIIDGDTADMIKGLEESGLIARQYPKPFTPAHYILATNVLTIASAVASAADNDQLDATMAEEIILRIAATVELLPFLQIIKIRNKITEEGEGANTANTIPETARKALLENKYSDEAASAIEKLSKEAIGGLITFIMSNAAEDLACEFTSSIILCLHRNNMLPEELLFSHMSACQRLPDVPSLNIISGTCTAIPNCILIDLLNGLLENVPGHRPD